MSNLPKHLADFLKENFPEDGDLAGYVICIAKRDKTYTVAQGYDSTDVRNKVAARLIVEMNSWTPQSVSVGQPPR